ncbi:sigma-54-dependent Fis family transcriptional regulator [Pseudonocardia humida]|uniref:Fis family transcriptional regulator n=1 Tax=Pseudonocardia humida TaxID=2800819 RepID=A0ABT0ZXZ8_9PSEU|nr:helix-turn-helix domain-containing protein [Pseudonocardia humida]MCO1655620.1 Fis family transcriptional regulator [Pseudonocardia humida]
MRRDQIRHLPTMTSAQRERTRRSREALVDGGLLAEPPGRSGVPRHIERSWRRCVGDEVPVDPELIAYRDPDDVLPVLRRAAGPVLDRLADSFAEVPVAMVLSDATGRIVMRYVAVRSQRDVMDRASAAEGFDYSEPSIGTNGIGTVLVERGPVLVRGPEHYNSRLEGLTCAGTPVFEPHTGRMVGTFSLACSLRDVHPLMTVMAGDIGRQIEARILEEAGARHRHLVQAYLLADRGGGAVLVVDERTVLANRPGLVHTGPELHPLLWRFLQEHGPGRARRMRVPLPDGPHDALVEPVLDAGATAYCVRLLPQRPGPRPEGPPALDAGPVAPVPTREPLHFHPDVARLLEAAVRHRELVAVTGPGGAGKLRTALRTLRRRDADDPLVVEPHLDPDWFAAARAAVAEGRGLVIRRVHETPAPSVAQVQALAAAGSPLALTADLAAADDAVLAMVRQVATTVGLPALAQHREQLPGLVRAVLAELPAPESATRFAPAVWERFSTWHWPGNLAELRTTVVALARRAAGGTVRVDDLPDELRTSRRSPGLLESAERAAVAEALRAAGGNRSRAAQALGIGRNTLYRKMREFGIS